MRYVLLISLFFSFSFASLSKSVILYYQFKNYEKACTEGMKILDKSNEAMLSLIGDACSKSDQIDILSIIAPKLISKKEYRENRSYFLTLSLQKSLLLQFLKDSTDIDYLTFPKTDHILSLIFNRIASKKYKKISDNPKIIEINTKNNTYRVSLSKKEPSVILIKEYLGDTVIKSHRIR